MRRLAACVAVLAVLVGLTRQSAHAEITAKEVRDSIERGVEYLKRQPKGLKPSVEHPPFGLAARHC